MPGAGSTQRPVAALQLLLQCCLLAGGHSSAAGEPQSCAVDTDGSAGTCLDIALCPELLQLAQTARPCSPEVGKLRELVKKCPRSPTGELTVCCRSELMGEPVELSERGPLGDAASSAAVPAVRTASGAGPAASLSASPAAPSVLPAAPVDLLPTVCGHQMTLKVVDGTDATIGQFPWMVSIQYGRTSDSTLKHGCGGTLISTRHVLTAAHCVTYLSDPDLAPRAVLLGELDFSSERDCLQENPSLCSDPPFSVGIEAIFSHPEFRPEKRLRFPNDIAVLRLEKEVQFTDFIRPVCLLTDLSVFRAGRSDLQPGQPAVVAGWGRSQVAQHDTSFTPRLQTAHLPVKQVAECERQFSVAGCRLPLDGRICAGGGPGDSDACRGDSGGPLMLPVEFGAVWYQIGVSSFGTGACGAVSGYTRVLDYADWILRQLSKK